MSLDLSKLENVRELSNGKVEARCPACAEAGLDRQGNHLRIDSDGRFCCVVNAGKEGALHRQRIFALVGKPSLPKNEFTVKVLSFQSQPTYSISKFLELRKTIN